MSYNDQAVQNFHCTKLFTNDENVTALDIAADGNHMVTCNSADQINLYEFVTFGQRASPILSMKYGVSLIRYARNPTTVIYSSTKIDDSLRYMDLSTKSFLSYFSGHTGKVTSVSVSPITDLIVSGSQDKTIRLWDFRTQMCLGVVNFSSSPIVTFDPQGVLFATIARSSDIELYDLRNYQKGPYVVFKQPQERYCDWTGIQFSPNGRLLLIQTNGSMLRLLNAYNGYLYYTLKGYTNHLNINLEPSFTSDSKYVLCGSTNGRLHTWNAASGLRIGRPYKDLAQPSVIKFLKCNPKLRLWIAAGDTLGLWMERKKPRKRYVEKQVNNDYYVQREYHQQPLYRRPPSPRTPSNYFKRPVVGPHTPDNTPPRPPHSPILPKRYLNISEMDQIEEGQIVSDLLEEGQLP